MPRCLTCACDARHPDHPGHYQCMDQNVANADGGTYEELAQHIYSSCNAPESRDQSLAGVRFAPKGDKWQPARSGPLSPASHDSDLQRIGISESLSEKWAR